MLKIPFQEYITSWSSAHPPPDAGGEDDAAAVLDRDRRLTEELARHIQVACRKQVTFLHHFCGRFYFTIFTFRLG